MGVGYWTSENTSNILSSGKRVMEGQWHNKLPTAKVVPEHINASLLNVDDAYRPGHSKTKGIGEVALGGANAVPAAIRDAVRHWHEQVNAKASASSGAITSPFASDDVDQHNRCKYMDGLSFTYTDRIREATSVSPAVLEYMANN